MKKEIEHTRVTVSFIICLLISIFTVEQAPCAVPEGVRYAEKFHFVCDKDVYCVHEKVFFHLYNLNQNPDDQLSSVVYVDVVTPDGNPVVQGKFDLLPDGATGELEITENVLTGIYYIRFYTKWMRDGQITSFFLKPLTIINPFSSKVLQHENLYNANERSSIDTFLITSLNDHVSNTLFVKPDQLVSIDLLKHVPSASLHKVSVSITRKGSVFHPFVYEYKNPEPGVTIVPETRGLSLSGKIVNKQDSLPIPNVGVWVSMPLKDQIIQREVYTNRKGEFYIDLGKEYGNSEIYIHPQVKNSILVPLVLADNDFAYTMVSLPFLTFHPEPDEEKQYQQMAVNSQLHYLYHRDAEDTARQVQAPEIKYNFYGSPDFVLTIDDFIPLPGIKDYINELMPMLKIKGNQHNMVLQVSGKNDNFLKSEPLLMYNHYKISDLSSILELVPQQLDRVEVVQGLYIRGDITYGGIVHFIPKAGAQTKVKLDEESILLPYRLFNKVNQIDSIYERQPHVPFVGNCLYWNPVIDFSTSGKSIIQFNTGSEPGTWQLKIEGIDGNNKPFINLSEIEVR